MDISFFKALRRGCASLLLGVSLMGLAGCATISGYNKGNVNYEKFFDSFGGHRLTSKDNDLFLDSKQITFTPEITEEGAFLKNVNEAVYYQEKGPAWKKKLNFFVIYVGNNEIEEKETSMEEYNNLWDSKDQE